MLDLFTKRSVGIVKKYIAKYRSKLKRLTNTRKYVYKFLKILEGKVKGILSSTPDSLDDYLKFGKKYIAKKVFMLFLVLTLLVIMVFYNYIFPWMEGRLWVPNIVINTEKYYSYSGKAKVFSEDKKLIYVGEMQDGRISGRGKLYDKNSSLVFVGEFLMEQYNGFGEKYDQDGHLIYKGQFTANLYSGQGELYKSPGILTYKGMFANGKYDGKGKYYENGKMIYEGDFKNGLFDGLGDLYYPNGNLKYQGIFQGGKMYGQGKFYSETGKLIYEGSFIDGLYEGTGTEYDRQNTQILYEGQFKHGKYHGLGKEYSVHNGRLLYEGSFKEGLFSGPGTLYNEKGQVIYTGDFFNGEIDYTQYVSNEARVVRESFGQESEIILFENNYLIFYDETKVAFSLDYGEEDEPRVNKIILLGDQKLMNVHKGITLKSLTPIFGEAYTQVDYFINEEKSAILKNLHIKDDVTGVYGVKYILQDDIFIRGYFLDPTQDMIYFEIGEV